MTLFEWYLLFCITTAIMAVLELLMPVMQEQKQTNNPPTNSAITYLVFFIIANLIAPLIFISCILPESGNRFRQSLKQGLFPIEEPKI